MGGFNRLLCRNPLLLEAFSFRNICCLRVMPSRVFFFLLFLLGFSDWLIEMNHIDVVYSVVVGDSGVSIESSKRCLCCSKPPRALPYSKC